MRVLLFAFFLCSIGLYAQEITILDATSKEPVIGAAVYNNSKSKSVVSDFDGKVSLSKFDKKERLNIQHVSYYGSTLFISEIKNNTILLTPNTQALDEIVISASRFKQDKRDVPQKISSIKKDLIELSNPQTSADLLQSSGTVYIQKSQLGGGSPIIRGFSTNRLLLSVDNVRMNNAIFRGGNVQNVISVDPFTIENT